MALMRLMMMTTLFASRSSIHLSDAMNTYNVDAWFMNYPLLISCLNTSIPALSLLQALIIISNSAAMHFHGWGSCISVNYLSVAYNSKSKLLTDELTAHQEAVHWSCHPSSSLTPWSVAALIISHHWWSHFPIITGMMTLPRYIPRCLIRHLSDY